MNTNKNSVSSASISSRSHGRATNRSPKRQKGIASILTVILVGAAITSIALGIFHGMRYTQERQIAGHAATNVQNSLWSGVEAFRLFLLQTDKPTVSAMTGQSFSVDMGAAYGNISIRDIVLTESGGQTLVSATIVSQSNAAKASASVGVIYELQAASSCSDCVLLPATINFYDDLDVNGAMDFTGANAGDGLDINVDGVVDIQNVNLSSIGTLTSTQSVTLHSGLMDVKAVHANGTVTVSDNNLVVGSVKAKGNVTVSGGSTVTNIATNNNISVTNAGYSATMNAIGNINVSGTGTHGTLTAGGTISWTSGGDFSALNAVGDISINSPGSGGDVISESTVDCGSSSWSYTSISVNSGATSNCGGTPKVNQSESVSVMAPITDFTLDPFVVDVYQLQGHANWVFSYDTSNGGRMLVRVQNINGIADGTYMVADKDVYYPAYASYKSHLCEVPASGNTCDTLVTPNTPVCIHDQPGTSCLFYQSGQWRIDGASAAPGIMWFEGDVNMNNGVNYTTILATGNIDTGGNFKGYAVNYAGFGKVCQASAPHLTGTALGKYTSAFSNRYPTNLCDIPGGKLKELNTGNIALAAGGYEPPGSVYSGGNIELSASNEVYGSVLAGHAFETDYGDTHVYGAIVAANLNEYDTSTNLLNGSTYINLSGAPDTYNPHKMPDMSGAPGGGGGNTFESATVLWSKFL